MKKKDFFEEKLGKTFDEFYKECDNKEEGNSSISASTGNYSKSASSGYSSISASSGNYSISASSGEYSKSASSGYSSISASSGDSSTSASSGYSSISASSGEYSKSASSGNYSKSASSGEYSTSASSGNYSKSASSGNYSSATGNGFFATVKGEGVGCLISAVEFNKDYQPIGVAWGIVGVDVEANKEYIAHNGKLKEYIVVDGISSILLSRKANVMKVLTDSFETLYIVTKDGYSAHGKTLKQANEDINFKIASEKLKNEPILEDTIVTVKHYRLITGACEVGVKSWMQENNINEGLTAKELLPILERTNAYGVDKFKSLISWD
jgi:hypothetical protein